MTLNTRVHRSAREGRVLAWAVDVDGNVEDAGLPDRRCRDVSIHDIGMQKTHKQRERPRRYIQTYQRDMDCSKRRARSSGLAGRGESFVTRCWGSVPSTSAGISEDW